MWTRITTLSVLAGIIGLSLLAVGDRAPLTGVHNARAQESQAVFVAETPTFVADIARQEAKFNGDPSATGQWIVTTRQTAISLESPDRVNSNDPVYYVVLHGKFVAQNAFLPAGADPPRGSTVAFTIDAKTKDILDFSISSRTVDLTEIGTPNRLALK